MPTVRCDQHLPNILLTAKYKSPQKIVVNRGRYFLQISLAEAIAHSYEG
ncbi:hypothetical protein [Nostoc sp.]